MVIPKCGGIPYEDADMVFLANPKQVIAYMTNDPHLHLYDCFVGYDGRLIYVFKKADTFSLYKRWNAHELQPILRGDDE